MMDQTVQATLPGMEQDNTPHWHGWVRTHGRQKWVQVVTADTEAAASAGVLRYAEQLKNVDLLVTCGDGHPNQRATFAAARKPSKVGG